VLKGKRMKRFQFRLEKLLNLRRYYEREWELKLADISGRCLVVKNEILEREKNIADSLSLRHVRKGELKPWDFLEYELYMARMRQEKKELEERLLKLKEEEAKVRQGYLEALKARKTLEKLKERRQNEYYHMARYEEFKLIDEINNSALIRLQILAGDQ